MAELQTRTWHSDPTGLTRRDRRPCEFQLYFPDFMSDRNHLLEGEVAAEVADAERAIARLNSEGTVLANTEALARLLLKAESVASSKIEGLEIGGRRLLHAGLAQELGETSRDVTANEVLNNIDAMSWAIEGSRENEPITLARLIEIHRRLLQGTRLQEHGGQIRTEQNWIGGSGYNPCSASFVPPPPERVEELLQDLCDFCNDDRLPAVAQAAIAHAQFETIHPFVDGNGRTGRVLIHVVLRKRRLATTTVPPISLVLATRSLEYVEALQGTRYLGAPDSPDARAGINQWIGVFAAACTRAVDDAIGFEKRVSDLQTEWRDRLGRVRAGSAASALIVLLTTTPVLTAAIAAEKIGRSFQATNEAIERLIGAGILSQITVGKRNRAFEARELVDAFTDLERQLASPSGNTRVSRPERPVARRAQSRRPV